MFLTCANYMLRTLNTWIRQCGETMNTGLHPVYLFASKMYENRCLFCHKQQNKKTRHFNANYTHMHKRRDRGKLTCSVKAPRQNFPINSHTLKSIQPCYGGNNDIMVTAGLLAERRRLWAGERKRHYVCVWVCVSWKGWETLASAGGKTFEVVHQAVHGIHVFYQRRLPAERKERKDWWGPIDDSRWEEWKKNDSAIANRFKLHRKKKKI